MAAETLNPNISKALYRYLCQNIVGTDDLVKQVRSMIAVRDNMVSNNEVTVITSGSFGEGLQMRGSDLDVMLVSKYYEVLEDLKTGFNLAKTQLVMEREDVKPGYTQLRLEYYSRLEDLNVCEEYNGQQYFSSTLHKQRFLYGEGRTIHGPCITDRTGDLDNAISLHCKTWVSPATKWITRSSNSWPRHDVKQDIIKHGVLFVPIGVKGSTKEDLEWRVSFSVGEKLLINTFSHTQLLCYALLKIILKDVIATSSECKDLLCSYFRKTIIFWISEELPHSVWKPDNIILCFMRCFNRLVYCVDYSVCLHYFIPENNMFEDKIEGRSREILLEKLSTLYSYGWRCILFSDQISNFNNSMLNFQNEPHTLYVSDIEKMINSKFLMYRTLFLKIFSEEWMIKNGLYNTVLSQQSSIKDIYKYCMSMCCSALAQRISLYSTGITNKYQYKQYKYCLSTLLQNVYHDAVSGWLMVASLFYKTKQYSKALYIIRYSISKCTPEKFCHQMTMSDYQLSNLNSYLAKSFVNLEKLMLADNVHFTRNSLLTPNELQIVNSIWKDLPYWFPCTSFAYFLEYLCQYHLNNVRQCQDSLQGLQLVIEKHYLISQPSLLANAYTLLGSALQLLGHNESARQAFLQTVELQQYAEKFVQK